ncbi:hypothetical protein SAMN05216217_1362 [Halopseudomonas yangmingensis]|uniref:Membrane protein involved in the export of O-antigen and teichoic acid n=2 Tax=Halopseudomonas yangmingensis TaxID=1720063 RepID=A0A1I4UT14_9GAMM|nr:hypothetical protein SAMN05216217_1362 [Halopseudomonas yangmingensis]
MAVLMGGMSNFGTHLVLLREISCASDKQDTTQRLALGTTALCGPVLLLTYIILAHIFFKVSGDLYWIILCIGAAEIIFQPFLIIAAMELHGKGRVARSQVLLIMPICIRLLVVAFIAGTSLDDPLHQYAYGHLIAVLLPLGYVVWQAPSIWREPLRWRVARRPEWPALGGYAITNISASGVSELDKMLAVRLLPLGIAGVYSAASRVVGSLVMPVMAMILSAMPRLFRSEAATGKKLQCWLFTIAGIYGFFAATTMIIFSPWIELALGEIYSGVSELIHTLAFAVPALCVRAAATNVLTTLGRPWIRISLELTGWVVIVVLALRKRCTNQPST